MHDVGKLFIPDRILNKPDPLDGRGIADDQDPPAGRERRCCGRFLKVERVAQAVESHHEAFDGSGYPFGLKGENIPLSGRIIAVADAYVNMTSERPFRCRPRPTSKRMAELGKLSGTRFDGMIVRLFARLLKMENAASFDGASCNELVLGTRLVVPQQFQKCGSPLRTLGGAASITMKTIGQGQHQPGIFGQIALAAKPVFHRVPKLIERNMRSNFQATVGYRQRVVKNRRVGEVAHAEIVEPFQRAGMELPFVLVFHADFSGKHV